MTAMTAMTASVADAPAGTAVAVSPTVAALVAATATAVVVVGLVVPPVRRRPTPPTTADHRATVLDTAHTVLDEWVAAIGTRSRALTARWRRRPVEPDDAAAWCDELARRIRAGSSVRDALAHTTPVDPDLRAAVAPVRLALERGASVADAAAAGTGDEVPAGHRHVALVLSVARACAVTGSPPAEPLDRAAVALRRRAADRDERAAQSAQARMSAHVMTVVPLVALVMLVVGDPRVRQTALTPIGAACLLTGGLLNALGWSWMRRITRVAP
jgi:tight adherence protein B